MSSSERTAYSRKRHALYRAKTRYDADFDEIKLNKLRRFIVLFCYNDLNKEHVFHLRKLSHSTSLFAVNYDNCWYVVVYQHRRREIRTLLPQSVLEEFLERIPMKNENATKNCLTFL